MAMFGFYKKDDPAASDEAGQVDANAAPAAPANEDDQAFEEVSRIIAEIRPFLQADGGDVELLKMEDGIVFVRLVGSCVGCPSSLMTLKHGVEARLKEAVPAVKSVEMV